MISIISKWNLLDQNLERKEFSMVLFDCRLEYNHHGDYGLETNEEVSEELGLTKMRHQPSIRIEKIEPSIDKSLE